MRTDHIPAPSSFGNYGWQPKVCESIRYLSSPAKGEGVWRAGPRGDDEHAPGVLHPGRRDSEESDS